MIFLCDQSYASHGRDFLLGATILNPNAPRPKTFLFLGVAGGTTERSFYSPHYVNTALKFRIVAPSRKSRP